MKKNHRTIREKIECNAFSWIRAETVIGFCERKERVVSEGMKILK